MSYESSKKAPKDPLKETPPELELAIMKKEAERAGVNYLWHPKFREYAQTPANYPLNYEEYYQNPRTKKSAKVTKSC